MLIWYTYTLWKDSHNQISEYIPHLTYLPFWGGGGENTSILNKF